jgi:hypothetical protein
MVAVLVDIYSDSLYMKMLGFTPSKATANPDFLEIAV